MERLPEPRVTGACGLIGRAVVPDIRQPFGKISNRSAAPLIREYWPLLIIRQTPMTRSPNEPAAPYTQ